VVSIGKSKSFTVAINYILVDFILTLLNVLSSRTMTRTIDLLAFIFRLSGPLIWIPGQTSS